MDGQIFKIKTNGDSLTQLTSSNLNFFPSWSTDGQWILFDSDMNSPNGMYFIWKMKKDGSNLVRIVYEPNVGEVRMPSWLNSSNEIVHIRYLVDVYSSEIFLMNSNAGGIIRITHNEATDYFPKPSPDNKKITFTSQPKNGLPQIYLVNIDGSDVQQITHTQGWYSDWSPDGEWIVYTDSQPNSGRLWVMRKDGSDKRQLSF